MEQRLLERARRGDREAFAQLVTLHREAVYRAAYWILKDPEEALDATQEAFLKAYRAIDRFDRAKETIQFFPYNIDTSGLMSQAEEGLKLATRRQKEREIHLREQFQKSAREEAAIWEQRNLAYHHARIRTLMEQAKVAFDRTEFEKAERLADSVMEIEPTHLQAKKLAERARHARRFQYELDTIEEKMEEMKRQASAQRTQQGKKRGKKRR